MFWEARGLEAYPHNCPVRIAGRASGRRLLSVRQQDDEAFGRVGQIRWLQLRSARAAACGGYPIMSDKLPGHETAAQAYFPDPIETADDSPVLLTRLLGAAADARGEASALRIIRIDGSDTSAAIATELPGIRVGAGDGSGYVLQRELDGQLVFVPDAGYAGITTFTYTIADDFGDEATVVATVSVQRAADLPRLITFVDGSHVASVAEGMDTAILGALSVEGLAACDSQDIRVFEGEDDIPSHRFAMSGDKLRVLEQLDHSTEETIHLKVVAYDNARVIAANELSIEVRPAGPASATPTRLGGSGAETLSEQLARPASLDALVDAAGRDEFHFKPDSTSRVQDFAHGAPLDASEEVEAAEASAAGGHLEAAEGALHVVQLVDFTGPGDTFGF